MEKPKVAILMSTYDGEKYIREQIDSIINQADVDIYLYIRDDHSNDHTVEIVEEYINKCPEKIYLKNGENIGPGYSFMDLVQCVPDTFDFYAYSDQDDIWLKDKMIHAVSKLQQIDGPSLYCSNQTLYIDGKVTHNRFETAPICSLKNVLCGNDFSGCTMVFNNVLKKILRKVSYSTFPMQYRFHDTWTCLLALIYGSVFYDDNSFILYRIHGDNTVGLRKRSIGERLKRFISSGSGRNLRSKTARSLLDNCEIRNEEDEKVLREFAEYQASLSKRLYLINDKSIRLKSGESMLSFGIKVMLNMF